MLKSILVGVSGTPDTEAKVAWTLDLARRHDAGVTLLSVINRDQLLKVGPVPLGATHYAERLAQHHIDESLAASEEAIEAFRAACSGAGVPLRVIREEGDPFEHLARAWRYADLCLLGARGWFDYGLVPEPEDALLRLIAEGVRPLLAVPRIVRPVRKVMIAYNGSIESAKAMKQFLQAPLWPGMQVRIVCLGPPKTGEDADQLLAQAADYARRHGFEPELDNPPLASVAWEALRDRAAESDADLIVLGSSYRRVLLSHRFGRNAINLIRAAEVPLFLSH